MYYDAAATTRPKESAIAAFLTAQRDMYANPSSLHAMGEEAARRIKSARASIAEHLGMRSGKIIFTSCATEASAMMWSSLLRRGGHVVATAFEHAAVEAPLRALENAGGKVTRVCARPEGISAEDLLDAIRPDTVAVAVMHVQNEIGWVQDVAEIARRIHREHPDVFVFCDGVQAVGKWPVDVDALGVDAYIVSAHKFHGLKGTGLLYLRRGHLHPLILGGGQEEGLRSGTENVGGILAMESALVESLQHLPENIEKARNLRAVFREMLGDIAIEHALPDPRQVPNIYHASAEGIRAEVLVHMLDAEGIMIGTGSACSRHAPKAGRVLAAIGRPSSETAGAFRISFDPDMDEEAVREDAQRIRQAILSLRKKIGGFHGRR